MNSGAVDLAVSPVTALPWVAASIAYLVATRGGRYATSWRQRAAALSGTTLGGLAAAWPLGGPAHRDFLWAMVVERLVLLLAVPVLLLLGTSRELAGRVSRRVWIDQALVILARPLVAIGAVTVLLAATVLPAVVTAGVHHDAVAALVALIVVLAGIILWLPVIDRFPGVPVLSAAGQCGYLIAQGVAPTFLSVVWIFAGHPLYPALGASSRGLMDPVLDQRIAGFVAKFATIAVLFTVAFVVLVRADPDAELQRGSLRDDDLTRVLERERRRRP